MVSKKKFLLLIGSPRKERSTSYSLGSYLLKTMKIKGYNTETIFLYNFHSDEDLWRLLLEINECNMIIVSSPLYIDCLPAHVIRVFEFLHQHKTDITSQNIHISVIINCGFPESKQNASALKIYKCFTEKMDFTWAGSLSLGMGGFINGRNLQALGGRVSQIHEALDCAAKDLIEDNYISKDAQLLFDKKIIPHWLYRFGGNIGWNRQSRKNGLHKKDIRNTPHISQD